MLIDIHAHILPGSSDGPETLKEAISMLKEAEDSGISGMVATPRINVNKMIKDKYLLKQKKILKKYNQLRDITKKKGINMDIYRGSIVNFYPSLGRDLDKELIPTINNSRYLLIEFPSKHIPEKCINVFYDLYHMGYKPIIAHPEHNYDIIKNPNILYDIISSDWALAQVNASSLLGVYGSKVKKTAKLLIKNNLVQFIASNYHSTKRKPSLQEGLKYINNITGNASYFIENSLKVISNDKIELLAPKKSLFMLPQIIKQTLSM